MDNSNKNVFKKKKSFKKTNRSTTKRKRKRMSNALKSEEQFKISYSFDESNSSPHNISFDRNLLSNWSFPIKIHKFYANKGINKLFDWQVFNRIIF